MKNNDWHELIQKQLAEIATPEETSKLEQALESDAKLRDLYLESRHSAGFEHQSGNGLAGSSAPFPFVTDNLKQTS